MQEISVVSCKKGWESLYKPVLNRILEYDLKKSSIEDKIGISDVKEKFGRLSIEIINPHNLPPSFSKMIVDAENRSEDICEYCGATQNVGHTYATRWTKTCCHECYINQVKSVYPLSGWKKEKNI